MKEPDQSYVEYQPVDEAADLSMKPLVVAEEYAEHLGQVGAAARPRGEHELLVRQPQQELLVHVLAKFAQPGASRPAWARLLARVYEMDALRSGLLRQGLGRERRPFQALSILIYYVKLLICSM